MKRMSALQPALKLLSAFMLRQTGWLANTALVAAIALFGAVSTARAQTFVHITDLHVGNNAIFAGGQDNNGANFAKMAEFIKTLSPAPSFVLASGDIVNTGVTIDATPGLCPDNGNWRSLTKTLTKSGNTYYLSGTSIPVYFTPGNHDDRNGTQLLDPRSMMGYDAYIPRIPDGCTALTNDPANAAYRDYYFVTTNALIYVMYSGADVTNPNDYIGNWENPESKGLGSAQLTFLKTTLAAYPAKQKIVVMHVPAVNPNGYANYGTDFKGDKFTGTVISSVDDGCIRSNRTQFLDTCAAYSVSLVLAGHLHQNVVLDRYGAKQSETWTGGTRYVQTAEGFNGALRVITANPSSVTINEPVYNFVNSSFVRYITPEMLHHSNPSKGKAAFHLYFAQNQKIRFKLAGFANNTVIKIAAHSENAAERTLLKASNSAWGWSKTKNDYLSVIDDTLTQGYGFVAVEPNGTAGMRQGEIYFEDLTWNAANKGGAAQDEYSWHDGKYVKTAEITCPKEPADVVKGPSPALTQPVALCKDCNEKGTPSKGSFVPSGGVVMCKDASWFCTDGWYETIGPDAGTYHPGQCYLIAQIPVDHFEKGWTYDYGYSSGRKYWISAGNGPVLATFIYNYGCHDNMNIDCKFYKPDGSLYYTQSQNFYCSNDWGFWGYVGAGVYIYDEAWFPEGQWRLDYCIGTTVIKSVNFDVCKAPTSNTLTFIDPTPAEGATISARKQLYNMTAGIASGYLPGSDAMKFYVDGVFKEQINVHEALGTSIWNVTNAAEGAHTIRAEVNSSYWGWVSSPTRTVYVDSTPPATCAITAPANGATLTAPNYTVTGSYSADVVKVEYYLDGILAGYSETAPFSKSISFSNDDSVAALRAVAYDAVGNKKYSSSVTVTIRSVKIISPSGVTDLPINGTVTIEAEAEGSTPLKIKFYVNGAYKGEDLTGPSYTYIWNTSGAGVCTLKVVAEYASYPALEHQVVVTVGGGVSAWSYTNPPNEYRFSSPACVIMNGYIYILGGTNFNSIALKTIERAKINPDGSCGIWEQCGNLAKRRSFFGAVHTENYIYIIAGVDSAGTKLNSIERIQVYADGSIGSSQTLASTINGVNWGAKAVTDGKYIWIFGGVDATNYPTSNCQFTAINTDGTLGAWTNTTSLSQGKYHLGGAIKNGYIYATGGQNSSTQLFNTVERAQINSNGTLSAWTTLPSLLTMNIMQHCTAVQGDFIYNLGGYGGPHGAEVCLSQVERAYIYPNGDLGTWGTVSSMNTYRVLGSAACNPGLNDAIYVVGGGAQPYGVSRCEYAKCAIGPTITNVASSGVTAYNATITWTTNVASNSRVDYWTDGSWPDYFSTPVYHTSPMVTAHSVTINANLEPLTKYYYRVVSQNSNGNTSMSGAYEFTTLATVSEGGLVACWPMNEITGSICYDATANRSNGTITGASRVGGISGNALSFNGTSNYVTTPIKNLSGSAITIAYWFKGSSLQSAVRQQSASGYIVAGWNGLHILSNDGGTASGISVGAAATNGNWHHVVMTWQQNTTNGFKSYLDGQLVAQRTSSNTAIPNLDNNLYLGSYLGVSEFTNGVLDEVRIYNKALSGTEVLTLYNSGCLAGYWKLDETSGTMATDASGNGNNGTLVNGPTWVSGQVGNALSFDGVDDYVDVGSNPALNITQAITIAAWIKRGDTATTMQTIFGKYNVDVGYNLYITNNKIHFCNQGVMDYYGTATITQTNYHYVVATYDRANVKLYLDGNLDATIAATAALTTSTGAAKIGSRNGAYYFKGTIDEVRIYSKALSAAEIETLYVEGRFVNSAKLAAGAYHSLALKANGTVWAWGKNNKGQLGDSSVTQRTVPVQAKVLNNAMAIAAGDTHSIAIKRDGTVWAWGYNGYGQLGDSTTTQRNYPVKTKQLTGVIAVAGGAYHSLALKSDGTVWAWGRNNYYQLGDSSTTQRNYPVKTKILTGVVAIAAGAYHSLALKGDGTVWAWGYNVNGQLGVGDTLNRTAPVQITSLSGVVAIAAGDNHSMVIKSDGKAWAWGRNANGQLGDSTTTKRKTPVLVKKISNVAAIEGGTSHSAAVQRDGTIWAWGYNSNGQLGDSTVTQRTTAVQVKKMSEATAIAAGSAHSAAIKDNGTVWGWGYNGYGQLGDNSTTQRTTPVQASGLLVKDAADIGTGDEILSPVKPAMPVETKLNQSHPNPFNRQAIISYQLASPANVSLKVYNINGQLVKTLVNECLRPGFHSVKWDGKSDKGQKVAAGVYLYRMEAGDYSKTNKLTVLR